MREEAAAGGPRASGRVLEGRSGNRGSEPPRAFWKAPRPPPPPAPPPPARHSLAPHLCSALPLPLCPPVSLAAASERPCAHRAPPTPPPKFVIAPDQRGGMFCPSGAMYGDVLGGLLAHLAAEEGGMAQACGAQSRRRRGCGRQRDHAGQGARRPCFVPEAPRSVFGARAADVAEDCDAYFIFVDAPGAPQRRVLH